MSRTIQTRRRGAVVEQQDGGEAVQEAGNEADGEVPGMEAHVGSEAKCPGEPVELECGPAEERDGQQAARKRAAERYIRRGPCVACLHVTPRPC